MNLPDPIKNFIHHFSKLPSIGPRQATRLAFHVIGSGKEEIEGIIDSLEGLESMSICKRCFFVFIPQNTGDQLCEICHDKKRDQKTIAIVEKETDLISIEKTNKFNGNYFITGSLQKNGVLGIEQKRRLETLKINIKNELGGQADEIIIATNPTTYGDFNAAILSKELKDLTKKITRLGRGIPTGGEIEFADEDTLGNALERRI
ncbi:MAG: recombination mediator RecR [Minisyncoccota bacterium]